MLRVVLATGNEGKYRELQALVSPLGVVTKKLPKDYRQVAERYRTFVENALVKARHASGVLQMPAMSDDSGLVVPSLGGAPGIKSARYSGRGRSDEKNIEKLLLELKGKRGRKRFAYYVCVLVFVMRPDDPSPIVATGTCHGVIASRAKGESGFGYDPVFYIPKYKKTMAEMPFRQKQALSHRAAAAKLFCSEVQKIASAF